MIEMLVQNLSGWIPVAEWTVVTIGVSVLMIEGISPLVTAFKTARIIRSVVAE